MKKFSARDADSFIVDVKYEQHISSLSPVLRREAYQEQDPYKVIPQHLPKDEADYLFLLIEMTESKWLELKKQ